MAFYEGKLNHLWVDLFILDRLPSCPIRARLMKLEQQIAFGLGMGHRRKLVWRKYHGLQKLEVQVLAGVGHFIPLPRIFRLQERWARKYTDQNRAKTGGAAPVATAAGDTAGAKDAGKQSCPLCGKKQTGSGKSFFSNYQPDFQYCTVEDDWEEPIEFQFEGEHFTGPKAWDKVLTMLYGDYMKLPRPEDRHPSHSGMELEILD